MYVKTKELGPIGGGVRRARPPRSANATAATAEITTLVNFVQQLADIEDELGLDRDDIDQ